MNRNIVLFTVNYPYGTGETFIENEIPFLAKAFKKIEIVPLINSTSKKLREVPSNVTYTSPLISCTDNKKLTLFLKGVFNFSPLGFALTEFSGKKVYKNKQWFFNWLSATCFARAGLASKKLKAILRNSSVDDIFYFYWADNSANFLPILRKNYKNKSIVRFHNTDIYEENKGGYLPYREPLFKEIDLAVCIAENGMNYLESKYPGHLKNLIVSKLGVFEKGVSSPGNGEVLNIVSCSGINDAKRVHIISEALKLITEKINWVHLGDGPLRDEIEKANKALPPNISVNLKGHVDNIDVFRHYTTQPIDLFLNVSKNEGIPVAIMEACSVGIPVIATDVGGVAEIVSDSNGKLIPSAITPEELASHIRWFYYDAPRAEMRENSRKIWHENFSAEVNYPKFCNLLKDL